MDDEFLAWAGFLLMACVLCVGDFPFFSLCRDLEAGSRDCSAYFLIWAGLELKGVWGT